MFTSVNIALGFVVFTSIVLMLTSGFLPIYMDTSTGKFSTNYANNSISWIRSRKDGLISRKWGSFNGLAATVAAISGIIVALKGVDPTVWARSNTAMLVLSTVGATLFGFHFVWSSCLDWVYRKIPRWPLVAHMIYGLIVGVTCLALSATTTWLIVPFIVLAIVCWTIGLLKGSGMSDGRLLSIIIPYATVIMLKNIWVAFVLMFVLVLVHAFCLMTSGEFKRDYKNNPKDSIITRLVRVKCPFGPIVMIPFYISMIVILLC